MTKVSPAIFRSIRILLISFAALAALEAQGLDGDDPIAASVGSPLRPEKDRARDVDRHPAEVLRFFEVAPGQKVADLMAGGGFYTELLARVVGGEGQVIAQNSPFVVERYAEKPLTARLTRMQLGQVKRLDVDLDAMKLPKDLDLALMVLFYHDTYWQEVDRAAMNRAIFDALRPGGIYGVIDHQAEAGSGSRDVKTLHRVDAVIVRREIEAAGFVWEAEFDVLKHPEDARDTNVFAPAIRGKTDRFIYRFRKPAN
jgi:predicted methyltransferase